MDCILFKYIGEGTVPYHTWIKMDIGPDRQTLGLQKRKPKRKKIPCLELVDVLVGWLEAPPGSPVL